MMDGMKSIPQERNKVSKEHEVAMGIYLSEILIGDGMVTFTYSIGSSAYYSSQRQVNAEKIQVKCLLLNLKRQLVGEAKV